jgi:hypothetical protein
MLANDRHVLLLSLYFTSHRGPWIRRSTLRRLRHRGHAVVVTIRDTRQGEAHIP